MNDRNHLLTVQTSKSKQNFGIAESGTNRPSGGGRVALPAGSGCERLSRSHCPARQAERANRLHRICGSIAARAARGEKKRRLIHWFAWYSRGRCYKCDPSRQLRFSISTIQRAFYLWKKGGQVAAALLQHYKPRRPAIPAAVLVRFAEFCGSQPLPSIKAAWLKFAARGGSFGRGLHASKPLKISYGQLRYNLPAADFYLIQAQLKAIQTAQTKLAQERLRIVADIRRRLPDRLPRRRVKKELLWEI